VSHEHTKSPPDGFREMAQDHSNTGSGALSKAPAPKQPKGSAHKLSDDELNMVTGGTSTLAPRDLASGLPTGKRMHKPFT
jgi:hypothetical protein